MSSPTLDKTKWQGVDLATMSIKKVANGYTVGVRGNVRMYEQFIFATGAEVADFIKDCLCGDTQDEGGGE